MENIYDHFPTSNIVQNNRKIQGRELFFICKTWYYIMAFLGKKILLWSFNVGQACKNAFDSFHDTSLLKKFFFGHLGNLNWVDFNKENSNFEIICNLSAVFDQILYEAAI